MYKFQDLTTISGQISKFQDNAQACLHKNVNSRTDRQTDSRWLYVIGNHHTQSLTQITQSHVTNRLAEQATKW